MLSEKLARTGNVPGGGPTSSTLRRSPDRVLAANERLHDADLSLVWVLVELGWSSICREISRGRAGFAGERNDSCALPTDTLGALYLGLRKGVDGFGTDSGSPIVLLADITPTMVELIRAMDAKT
jgi:hypothetical protein